MKYSSYKDKACLQQLLENWRFLINDFNYFYLSFYLLNLIENSVKNLQEFNHIAWSFFHFPK